MSVFCETSYAIVNKSSYNFKSAAYFRWAQFSSREEAERYLTEQREIYPHYDLVLVLVHKC